MNVTTAYLDHTEAQTYFDERLPYPGAWQDATVDSQTRALKSATRAINQLNFIGDKTVATQANEFPRAGDVSVPDDIKVACCEIAFSLLDGVDMELERANLVAENQGLGDARSTYNRNIAIPHLAAGIASARAFDVLKPYLRDPYDVRVSQV